MGFFNGLKQGLNIGGPKVVAAERKLAVNLDDHDVPVAFSVINRGTPAHVVKFRMRLETQHHGGGSSAKWSFYRETVYDNGGIGWDLEPEQILNLTLPVLLNDVAYGIDVRGVLERDARLLYVNMGSFAHMRLCIYADVANVAVDPQAWVDIYVNR
jgi:hypothetical protein